MVMVKFSAVIEKYGRNGEKTGWTYVSVPKKIAGKINPGVRKSFRVKGTIDGFAVKQLALVPVGQGDFIIALNAEIRKGISKKVGEKIQLHLEVDVSEYRLNSDFLVCLKDDAIAFDFFQSLSKGHQNYFSKWIDSAKTLETKSKRIAMAIDGLSRKMNYGEMIRFNKGK